MCCFSAPVQSVANTKIFARKASQNRQYLVYEMLYAAERPVAMILPLPIDPARRKQGARFINLKEYPRFFADMAKGFPEPRRGGLFKSRTAEAVVASAPLPVESVGDFVASFVPSQNDFARLDRRFVIPRQTWEQIPAYRDYGFAVFQLREARGRGTQAHPMALEFTTRTPNRLFFPTVHIHDGRVHDYEQFDHTLYFQRNPRSLLTLFRRAEPPYLEPTATGVLRGTDKAQAGVMVLSESPKSASAFMNAGKSQGIVSPRERCSRIAIGRQRIRNQDLWLPLT